MVRSPGGGVTRFDPVGVAREAGLTYVTDAVPGISRERTRDGWLYRRPERDRLSHAEEAVPLVVA
jgi:DNA topoisomerase IB